MTGTETQPRASAASVVKIYGAPATLIFRTGERRTGQKMGGGVVVARSGWSKIIRSPRTVMATADHLLHAEVQEETEGGGFRLVKWADEAVQEVAVEGTGKACAKVIDSLPALDLAFLTVDDYLGPPMPFASKQPMVGRGVRCHGYPSGTYECVKGVLEQIDVADDGITINHLKIHVPTRLHAPDGYSGGMVTIVEGGRERLLGLLVAAEVHETSITLFAVAHTIIRKQLTHMRSSKKKP
jgi:hypothetical protein